MKIFILYEISTSYDMLGDTEPKEIREIIIVSNNLVYLQLEKERLIKLNEYYFEKHMNRKPTTIDEHNFSKYDIKELHPNQVHLIL